MMKAGWVLHPYDSIISLTCNNVRQQPATGIFSKGGGHYCEILEQGQSKTMTNMFDTDIIIDHNNPNIINTAITPIQPDKSISLVDTDKFLIREPTPIKSVPAHMLKVKSKKPRVLLIADIEGGVFERTANNIRRKLAADYAVDVSFINANDPNNNWPTMIKLQPYNVVWHLWHKAMNPETISSWQKRLQHNGTKFVATINHQMTDDMIQYQMKTLSQWDYVTVNNPQTHAQLSQAGIACTYTPNGVDLQQFGCDIDIIDRPWRVCFVSSEKRGKEKGYFLFHDVAAAVKAHYPDIEFVTQVVEALDGKNRHALHTGHRPLIDENNVKYMRELYNTCKVYVCLSSAEGGPNPLLESSACGCIPVCTRVGYAPELMKKTETHHGTAQQGYNGILINRDVQQCAVAIMFIKQQQDEYHQTVSRNMQQRIEPYSLDTLIQNYKHVLDKLTVNRLV